MVGLLLKIGVMVATFVCLFTSCLVLVLLLIFQHSKTEVTSDQNEGNLKKRPERGRSEEDLKRIEL